ncbi:MAG: 30S ribosomal protein S4, partial [Candidatus Levybacteria bacterium]|nr:30S ribosomal protein S4 [Candidatus Levybacteria bacterium]
YTGPKHRLARREGVNILDKSSQSLARRLNTPPGVHGGKRGKRRLSEFGLQLREKQKAKAMYGILEKQFSKLVKIVEKQKGDTGEMLLSLLETRLDNVVYRLGFAKTRYMARQLVSHGHVKVNDKKVDIASYQVKQDSIVTISDRIQKNPDVAKLLVEKKELLPFIAREGTVGKLLRMPKRQDIEVPFNMQQIIEYYSR